MEEGLFIGQLSHNTGLSNPTIRYYEKLGLIDPPQRTHSGYRIYSQADQDRLAFIQKAKRFGLSLEEIKQLIAIRQTGEIPCRELKQMIQKHLTQLDRHLQQMQEFREELNQRYDQIDSLLADDQSVLSEEICQGKICGFIEHDS